MIKPETPEHSVLASLTTIIDKKFDERPGFGITDISFALFYHYLDKLSIEDNDHLTRRNHCLSAIVNDLEQQESAAATLSSHPFFFNCLAHLLQQIQNESLVVQPLVQRINVWNNRLAADTDFDITTLPVMGYLSGWAGVLYYFRNLPATFASRQLLLNRHFEPVMNHVQWMCEQELFLLPYETAQTDMGLANGICGILMVVADAAHLVNYPQTARIIGSCVHQLVRLRQEVDQPADKCSFFPYRIDNRQKVALYNNCLSWNNSDLGHALLLCRAALLCKNANYLRMAEMIALNTLLRKTETHTGIHDATVQHGAAGVALLYKRLFAFTGRKDLLKGYHYWMDNALAMTQAALEKEETPGNITNILEGLAGTGLTLLSRTCGEAADWSKILLA
jgi:hypothetical protein